MSRILYRLVGNNPIQPNNFWIKTIGKSMWYNILNTMQNTPAPWNKATSSEYSERFWVPGIVPGCRQVKMTFCRQDYPATSCTPIEKMNWYQLTRLLWSNRDFSPNTPNLYLQSYTRAILYNTSSAVSAEGRKTSYTYSRRLYEKQNIRDLNWQTHSYNTNCIDAYEKKEHIYLSSK